MPLFTYIDPRLGPQDEVHAERIDYHVLDKQGRFFWPGAWRQLDPKTGRTVRFVLDGSWREFHWPSGPGAFVAWEQKLVPARYREDLPEELVTQLEAEGHRLVSRAQVS